MIFNYFSRRPEHLAPRRNKTLWYRLTNKLKESICKKDLTGVIHLFNNSIKSFYNISYKNFDRNGHLKYLELESHGFKDFAASVNNQLAERPYLLLNKLRRDAYVLVYNFEDTRLKN